MILKNIIKILKESEHIQQFLNDIDDFDLLIKDLDQNEIKRIIQEYPDILKAVNNNQKILKQESETEIINPILCLTFIKRDNNNKNYDKLKKIKIYSDELSGKILRILKN